MFDDVVFARTLSAAEQQLRSLGERANGDVAANAVLTESLHELSKALEELRAVQEELRQQNEKLVHALDETATERHRYRELFEFAPDAYLVTSTDGVIRESNEAASQLFGFRPQALAGKPLAVLVTDKDRPNLRARLLELAHAPLVSTWEMDVMSGTMVTPVEASVAAAKSSRGETIGLRWIVRDISERRTGQQRLKAVADQFRVFANSVPLAIVGLAHDGRIIRWNVEAERLFGWNVNEALGRFFVALCIPLATWREAVPSLDACLAGRSNRHFQTQVVTRDGSVRYVEWLVQQMPASALEGQNAEVVLLAQEIKQAAGGSKMLSST